MQLFKSLINKQLVASLNSWELEFAAKISQTAVNPGSSTEGPESYCRRATKLLLDKYRTDEKKIINQH